MLKFYVPTASVPAGCSSHYSSGWLYADWWLGKSGSPDADSPDGWREEKYEGWWDRLALAKRELAQPACIDRPAPPGHDHPAACRNRQAGSRRLQLTRKEESIHD